MAQSGDKDNHYTSPQLSGGDKHTHYINRTGPLGGEYTVAKGEGSTYNEARENCYKDYNNS
jgi:hypothetical protein